MEFDLSAQPEIVQTAVGYILQGWEIAKGWLLSPEAWSQFGLLLAAYLLALLVSRKLRPVLERIFDPGDSQTVIARIRRFVAQFIPLLLPLMAYVFTGIGETIVRSIFDSGAVIAFGKRVFLFLAVRAMVRDIVKDPMLKVLGRFIVLPIAALYTLGLLDLALERLEAFEIGVGNISFSAMSILRGVIAGGFLFWLGRWSNDQSAAYIHKQEEIRPATRELAAKAAELLIFGVAFLLLMNIMGISLTSLAVIGGAVGVGLGFGLQKIASNFISGVILLIEGQTTVGDFVELDGGEAGTIVKMTARAAILETFDGRWIVVPNEDFITTRVVNFSDSGSANRYDAAFSVSYDTDINTIPEIVGSAVAKLDFVLSDPEEPDVELSGFGDSGIDFVVEFWVEGIDDGKNKYQSKVLFAIWNALREHDIEIPFPQRVVHLKGTAPA